MFEIIANFSHWAQLSANLILFGSFFFLAIVWQKKVVLEHPASWLVHLEKIFPWLAGVVVLGLIGILATTTGEATGHIANTWNPDAWIKFVQRTQVGLIAFVRILLAASLFATVALVLRKNRQRWHYVVCAFAASLPLIAGTFVSHSSADEMSFVAIAPFALHILLAGVWFGALPVFLLIVFNSQHESDKITRLLNASFLNQFSTIALPVMFLLLATGLIVADRMVEGYYHTLVSSPYGWLLNFKLLILAIILIIAYQVRYKWLPLISQVDITDQIKDSITHLKKWVRIEFILALALMLVATVLANTLPAKHTIIENWPFPFRFAFETTSEESIDEELFWFGTALFFVALSIAWIGIQLHWSWKKMILAPAVLTLTAMGIALPPVTIEAYPETYLKPLIPFDAISISHGARLYAEHCVDCHGPQGKGNGALAGTLSSEPTDLLTEPHTRRHTVGNFYHWIANGISGTDMSGFSETLSEDDIWDVINFLHALSRGFDARLLGTMILPETPAIASPVFFYAANDGSSGDLKDFRLEKNVILVFFSWPQSHQRLLQLKHFYEKVSREHNTEILAIPMQKLTDQEMEAIIDIVPFPIVTEGWSQIRDTYLLYRRVRTVPDLSGPGMTPVHMEFMIDRFGYLRARWNAQFEGFGWQNFSALSQQLDLLSSEDEIMPPPGDHAH
ncbi:putative copper resistance protein D [Nitrosomonas aestuarii]|uniref:Putative copper resistance protein D n=1 Tax=Nitrosomonas aestuarii TaxID=52441 RepID=A0A1I3YRS4_9PROT|nr:CopD family protein [Nitrosomonas aestuarii]SFK34505.1 putative copper resistance protein D [Nitrosomonas aestuarii]